MRTYHKSWQDKRPNWSRRVRWYEDGSSIRIELTDDRGRRNEFYVSRVAAQSAFDAFKRDDEQK